MNANALIISANVCNFALKCTQTAAIAISSEANSGTFFSVKITGTVVWSISFCILILGIPPNPTSYVFFNFDLFKFFILFQFSANYNDGRAVVS